jgi:uncharacterized protein
MTIDWTSFTPLSALAGGLMIGTAATLLLASVGRVMGVSGILGAMLTPSGRAERWRWGFLGGLLAAPMALVWLAGWPIPKVEAAWPLLIAGGLLVGYGTRLGAGCTSGHGICGIARFSPRAIVATMTFMATGFTTVYLLRHAM